MLFKFGILLNSKVLSPRSSKRGFSINRQNFSGNIYIKSTNKNIFCTLWDPLEKKVKTSCSLKVVKYENEFNERVNLFKRGLLLGRVFGDKVVSLGYKNVAVFLNFGANKGRKGVLKGLGQNCLSFSFIELSKTSPHNGCRPSKAARKKVRTKYKSLY